MNGSKIAFCLGLWLVPLQCTNDQGSTKTTMNSLALEQIQAFPVPTEALRKSRSGKLNNATKLPLSYNKTNLSTLTLPFVNQQLTQALEQQLVLLRRRKQNFSQQFDNIQLDMSDLETTIEMLLLWQQTFPQGLSEHLNAYQLKGKDGKGNVKFTGYFTPELKVSKRPTKKYKYPIYAFPDKWEGILPTRSQIDGDQVLAGKGLELAYAQRLEDIYYMQLQGSALVKYTDGKRAYLGYAGSNKHSYSSIGRYISNNSDIRLNNISMQGIKSFLKDNPELVKPILFTNPSYIFFEKVNSEPLGAGHVPLNAGYSIAVDTRHIPLGSCLLAAMPVLDEAGDFSHHEFQFLLAQDVGGAIRGNGHVDVYCGTGEEGQKKASALHHFGQLWLLLPKPSDELGPVFKPGTWVDN